jgi:hypothetical protein
MGSTSLVGQRNLIIVTITGDTRIGPRTLCTALSCGLTAIGVQRSDGGACIASTRSRSSARTAPSKDFAFLPFHEWAESL